jgi:hypothetical protein
MPVDGIKVIFFKVQMAAIVGHELSDDASSIVNDCVFMFSYSVSMTALVVLVVVLMMIFVLAFTMMSIKMALGMANSSLLKCCHRDIDMNYVLCDGG